MPSPAQGSGASPTGGGTSSIWSLKPWWCQPWSIVATGLALVGGSVLWPGRWWLSLILGLLVAGWWLLFLVLVPASWARQQQSGVDQGVDQGPG